MARSGREREPAGFEVKMWFDNSPETPANPDASQTVRFGGPTTDEMALGWIYYSYEDEKPSVADGYVTGPTQGSD